MGNRSKFTFPVPGRKAKPSPPSTRAGPALTKAERILGTGGINVDSPTNSSSVRSPPQPWDAKSGISISISESSDGYATVKTGLGIRSHEDHDYDDSGSAGPNYGHHAPCPWDLESDIIPRQLRHNNDYTSNGQLRQKKSAATIGHDYRGDGTTTGASTAQRRQSNASTIFTHYDPHQVPLSISQQTSSSAMAKGLPTKITDLLDADGMLAVKDRKQKPAKLDLSLLRPKNHSRKDVSPNLAVEPVLGNNYVTRSPSFVSQTSPVKDKHDDSSPFAMPSFHHGLGSKRASRKLAKLPPGGSSHHGQSNETLPSLGSKTSEVNQLYDHYERQLFGQDEHVEEDETEAETSSPLLEFPMPPSNDHRFSSEPSPPLTTASTHMSSFITPLSNPVTRQAAYQPQPQQQQQQQHHHNPQQHQQQQQPQRNRKDSTSSRRTTTGISPPLQNQHIQNTHGHHEDAASISSRNTRGSKVSQQKSPLDTDLQQRSVLSLSDSESDDETFSDSAPVSSMSSHGQTSHGGSPASDYRNKRSSQPMSAPLLQDHHNNHNGAAAESNNKANTFSQLSDFLTVPTNSSTGHLPRVPTAAVSHTTLRSASSSSTTTGISNKSGSAQQQQPSSDRGGSNGKSSARSSGTMESLTLRAKKARQQPQDAYGVHEAKVIAILPVASTADAASQNGMSEPSPSGEALSEYDPRFSRQRNSDQPTPPLSPTSVDFYIQSPPKSIDRSSVSVADASEAHNARFMAVTRQEEMLLAALRKKRAIMRENILAEFEGEKGSVASLEDASASSSGGSRSSRQFEKTGTISSHGRKSSAESMPRTNHHARGNGNNPSPVIFPGRSSSLARNMKDLTAERGNHRSESPLSGRQRTGPASQSAMRAASSSRLPASVHRAHDSDDRHRLSYGSTGVPTGPLAPGQQDRRERVLMFLDRPLGGLDAIDSAEPSPDLSEFLDFDMESERGGRSRARSSRYSSSGHGHGHGHGHGNGYGHSTSTQGPGSRESFGVGIGHGVSKYNKDHQRKPSNRPRADSNALVPMVSPLRVELDGVPEQEYDLDHFCPLDADDLDDDVDDDLDFLGVDDDDHFDGFSDVMQHPTMTSTSSRAAQKLAVARPDSPVQTYGQKPKNMLLGHIKGKNSAVRISAVGPSWGDDD
ncbi:hypothetical protein PG985_003396 [Apiospora marii]|uniref:Uncharacterized protein n=1 Tax=Apiospora marii TaxID=335849 RepID=A0ABR1RWZ3_9PEZI